jgi:hypothetical protein
MLSVVASRIQVPDLAERWFPLHRVCTPDEQCMLLRFADTRILPTLPSILEPAQWVAFAGSLEHWFYVSRTGVAAACELPPPDQSPAPVPIRLTQAQLDASGELSETDLLLDQMADQHPDLFPRNAAPATIYQYVTETEAIAKKCHVEGWNDRFALLTADFITHGEIRSNPQLELLLRSRDWAPRQLLEALLARGLI